MTILVGVRCTDGVVIGADSITTSAMGAVPLIHLESDPKIQIFNEAVIVATTGAIGFRQRLHFHIEAAIKGGVFAGLSTREVIANIPKRFLPELHDSKAMIWGNDGFRFGGLMAAAAKDGHFLVEYGTTDFQPELKTGKLFFVSMGSGQMLADPFLTFVGRVLWKGEMPDVDHGRFGVYWVLAHTIKLAPGTVGPPICLATLRKIDGKWVAQEHAPQEAAEYIHDLEDYIGNFAPTNMVEGAKAEPIPQPEPKES